MAEIPQILKLKLSLATRVKTSENVNKSYHAIFPTGPQLTSTANSLFSLVI